MRATLILLLLAFAISSCSNPGKAEEADRKNLYQAEFFYENGAYGRALSAAKKIKKSSPRYSEAQELIRRIEPKSADDEFGVGESDPLDDLLPY
jgi:hypothetical protein